MTTRAASGALVRRISDLHLTFIGGLRHPPVHCLDAVDALGRPVLLYGFCVVFRGEVDPENWTGRQVRVPLPN